MDIFEALIRIAEAAAEKNREAQRSRAQAMYRAPVPPGSAPMPPVPPQVRQAQTPRVDPRVPQPQRVPVGKQRRGQRLAARRPPLIAPPPVPSSVATPIPATAPAPQPPPRPA